MLTGLPMPMVLCLRWRARPLSARFRLPMYLKADTVTLVVENFSAVNTDNFIALDGKQNGNYVQ